MPAPTLPFTISRDSNESAPWHFAGIESDAEQRANGAPWIVPIITKPLWNMHRTEVFIGDMPYLKGGADYSIDGLEHRIQLERKSVADLYSTLGQRRSDFEAEICRLNMLEFAAVIIEGDWRAILDPPANSQLNPKTVSRTILSWSIRYPRVHWFPCVDRRHAEKLAFQLLRQFWRQSQ